MFGLLAALTSLSKRNEGREALNYQNYTSIGQRIPPNKIYRESSADRRARQELGAIRYKQQIKQQIKFVRLMKKLLMKIDHEMFNPETDDELEEMRKKIIQIQLKVEKVARTNNINCDDMFDMHRTDDTYDTELEETIRNAILNVDITENTNSKATHQASNFTNETLKQNTQSCVHNTNTQISHTSTDDPYDHGDLFLIECLRKT
ncbi:unnamed protein product [Rotaria socialis]|uniref:Uncharacterized protein n=2 Tax=Rotaria socialis TaxID=392032 RepID=A0A821TAS5_9BILA|nr:unnamed protein product [Rotaria socialis]CAF3368836.1 unnamed protein product [Rotaria socialis]CAF3368884.1 unnamed protein product [Rotaria socialis]CAF3415386.1 unnamed protein product [Rotaria socialis]CAF4346203.1 unnamed protein product [Rotaria socialis]